MAAKTNADVSAEKEVVEKTIEQMIEEARRATQKMIAEAQAEAERILGEAKGEAGRTKNGRTVPVADSTVMADIRQREAEMQQKVRIKLFKDGRTYKDPLYVAVNGHNFMIERGVEVEVPRYVEEVIQNMEEQNILVSELVAEAEKGLAEN